MRPSLILLMLIAVPSCARHHVEQRADGVRPDGGPATITADDFAKRLSNALCTGAIACCDLMDKPHDEALCRTTLEAQLSTIREYLEADGYELRPAQAQRCLDELSRATTDCRQQWYSRTTCGASCTTPTQHLACGSVFSGDAEEGEPCETSTDCLPYADGVVYCHERARTCERARYGAMLGDRCLGTCTGSACSIVPPDEPRSDAMLCDAIQGLSCRGNPQVCELDPIEPTYEDECTDVSCESITLEQAESCWAPCCTWNVPAMRCEALPPPQLLFAPTLLCTGEFAALDDDYTACSLGFPRDDDVDDDEDDDDQDDETCE